MALPAMHATKHDCVLGKMLVDHPLDRMVIPRCYPADVAVTRRPPPCLLYYVTILPPTSNPPPHVRRPASLGISHVYTCTCVHALMCTCVVVYMCTCAHVYLWTCVPVNPLSPMHVCMCSWLHAYMCSPTCACATRIRFPPTLARARAMEVYHLGRAP